jgi:hypothetical protein
MHLAAKALCLRGPLSSNVRRHKQLCAHSCDRFKSNTAALVRRAGSSFS